MTRGSKQMAASRSYLQLGKPLGMLVGVILAGTLLGGVSQVITGIPWGAGCALFVTFVLLLRAVREHAILPVIGLAGIGLTQVIGPFWGLAEEAANGQGRRFEVQAVIYSLIALSGVVVGFRVSGPSTEKAVPDFIHSSASPPGGALRLLVAWMLLVALAGTALRARAALGSSLATLLGSLRFLPVGIAAYRLATGEGRRPSLVTILMFELLFGLSGTLAGFVPLLMILFSASRLRSSIGAQIALLGMGVALSAGWQLSKAEIRERAAEGEPLGTWEVVSTLTENLLLSRTADEVGRSAGDVLLSRLSYVEFFSEAIRYRSTGADRNHEGMLSAIGWMFAPRILFPDKPNLDATARLEERTGLQVRSAGTSISLGWPGELFCSGGVIGLALWSLVIGLTCGLISLQVAGSTPSLRFGSGAVLVGSLPYGLEATLPSVCTGLVLSWFAVSLSNRLSRLL